MDKIFLETRGIHKREMQCNCMAPLGIVVFQSEL